MYNSFFEKFKLFLNLLILSVVVGFVFSVLFVRFANAQVSGYTRTPSDLEIPEGTTINFSSFVTFPDNVESTQINIDGNFSSCVDTHNSDEQGFDVDMILPVGNYNNVDFLGYNGFNDCSNDPYVMNAESGSPAFSVVSVPPVLLSDLRDFSIILTFGLFWFLFGFITSLYIFRKIA